MAYPTRWTRLVSAAALAAAAAVTAAGCTAAPSTSGNDTAGHAGASAPAVTKAEAARAFQRTVTAFLGAGNAPDAATALAATTDVAWVQLSTGRLTARYFGVRVPASPMTLGKPVFYLPRAAGYPRWFVADARIGYHVPALPARVTWVGAPGGIQWENADGPALFLCTKASATSPWQLAAASKLAPGVSPPRLSVDGTGHVPTVPLSGTALLAQPDIAGPLQAAVVDDGPASPAARVVANGPLTTGIYDNERAGLLGLTAPRGDVLQWELEGSHYRKFALRTASGGALVFYAMYLNTTVQTPASLALSQPLEPGPAIGVPRSLAPLLRRGLPAPRIKLEGQQLLSFAAVDPPANGGKVQVIAIGGDWSYASAS